VYRAAGRTRCPPAACLRRSQVVQFRPDGGVEERQETAESLGLEPRDLSLFQPRPAGLDSPQRATLTPRGHLILFRTEAAAAVIFAERACLFPCRCGRIPPDAGKPPAVVDAPGQHCDIRYAAAPVALSPGAAVKDNSTKSRAGESEKRRGPAARWGRPLDSAAQACPREPGGPRVQGQPGARQRARARAAAGSTGTRSRSRSWCWTTWWAAADRCPLSCACSRACWRYALRQSAAMKHLASIRGILSAGSAQRQQDLCPSLAVRRET